MSFFGSPNASQSWGNLLKQAINNVENRLDQVLDIQPDQFGPRPPGTPGQTVGVNRTRSVSRRSPTARASSQSASNSRSRCVTASQPSTPQPRGTPIAHANSDNDARTSDDGISKMVSDLDLVSNTDAPSPDSHTRTQPEEQASSFDYSPSTRARRLTGVNATLSDPLTSSTAKTKVTPTKPSTPIPEGRKIPSDSKESTDEVVQSTVLPSVSLGPTVLSNSTGQPFPTLEEASVHSPPPTTNSSATETVFEDKALQSVIAQRESQLMKANQRNSELVEQVVQLQTKVDQQKLTLSNTSEFHTEQLHLKDQHISRLEEEVEALKQGTSGKGLESKWRKLLDQHRQELAEKDRRIEQLLREGGDWSKQEFRLSNTIKKLRGELGQRDKQITELQGKLESTQGQVDEGQRKLQQQKETEQRKHDQLRSYAGQIDQLNRTVLDLQKTIKRNKETEKGLQQALHRAEQINQTTQKKYDQLQTEQSTRVREANQVAQVDLKRQLEESQRQCSQAQNEVDAQCDMYKQELATLKRSWASKEANWQSQLSSLQMRLELSGAGADNFHLDVHEHTQPLFQQITELTRKLYQETEDKDVLDRKYTQQLKKLQKKLGETRDEVFELRSRLTVMTEQNQERSSRLENSNGRIRELETQLEDRDAHLESLEAQLEETRITMTQLEQSQDRLTIHQGEGPPFTGTVDGTNSQSAFNSPEHSLSDTPPATSPIGESLDPSSIHVEIVHTDQPKGSGQTTGTSPYVGPTVPLGDHGTASAVATSVSPVTSSAPGLVVQPSTASRASPSLHHHFSPQLPVSSLQSDHSLQSLFPGQLMSQIASLQTQLRLLTTHQSQLEEELVHTKAENSQLQQSLDKLQAMDLDHQELRRHHTAVLELLGEKTELVDELKADITDIKDMYKVQIMDLVNKMEELTRRQG
ncbi:hypothetical protein IWQ61_010193 [Dispira simplex]|nr:hypothetical protein IWQ61_010193 [Dispira simplex]